MAKNQVMLIGHYGSDLTHACSGWASTLPELTPEKIARVPGFLQRLRDGSDGHPHGTPFEKSFLHFIVRSDIASHIHMLKHRIAVSINSESARYKELKADTAFIPDDWPEEWQQKLEDHAKQSFALYHECVNALVAGGMDRKRAKESSRFFNPYATQLTVDLSFNFRSFTAFCGLRAAPGAQKEIRNITEEMIRQIMALPGDPFHHSIRVWGLNTLVNAP